MDMLNQKQKTIAIAIMIIVIGIIIWQYFNGSKNSNLNEEILNTIEYSEETTKESEQKEKIIVHITGAVKNNGIVKVDENARINDVIDAAGGLTDDADLTNVNLAYIIEDGQKIYIPYKGEEKLLEKTSNPKEIITDEAGDNVIENNQKEKTNKININKAGIDTLKTLPGIGEATALKILEYRENQGKYKSIEELKDVSGIGEAKFNTIKDLISV